MSSKKKSSLNKYDKNTIPKKKILVLCPHFDSDYITDEISKLPNYSVEIIHLKDIKNQGTKKFLDTIIKKIKNTPSLYSGVIGLRDETAAFAAAITEKTHLKGPSFKSLILCQNKYLSRCIQKSTIPQNTPEFELFNIEQPPLNKPSFFAKPVKSSLSFSIGCFSDHKKLNKMIQQDFSQLTANNSTYSEILDYMGYTKNDIEVSTNKNYLCESFLKGQQYCLEGFVYNNEVTILGTMLAGGSVGQRAYSWYEFPSPLSGKLLNDVHKMADKIIKAKELNNTTFDIEFKIDPEAQTIGIIEINSRMGANTEKVFKGVYDINLFQLVCDLATGIEPQPLNFKTKVFPLAHMSEPSFTSDKLVIRIPSKKDQANLVKEFPHVSFINMVKPGQKLSDIKQSTGAYSYCHLGIPGQNREDIIDTLEKFMLKAGYIFQDI